MNKLVKMMGMMAVTMALTAYTAQGALIIDNFDFGGHQYDGPGGDGEGPGVPGTFGGNRASSLTAGGTPAAGSRMEVNSPPPVSGIGRLSFSNDFGVDSLLSMFYTSSSAVDLTAGAADRIQFGFLSADQPFTLSLTIDDGAGPETITHAGILAGAFFLHDFLYSEFSSTTFSSVFSVVFTLSPDNTLGGDYLLEFVEAPTIPAPAALPAGLALMGAWAMFRRRRLA